MRKLVFGLIALLSLFLVVEIGVTLLSQKGMERALQAQYDLPSSLQVSINSFPFILSLARNHLAELEVSWEQELEYVVEEGMYARVPCGTVVDLYDVELNMTSLFGGKLDIRSISRMKAIMSFDAKAIADLFGLPEEEFVIQDDEFFRILDGEKYQYKIKVNGDSSLELSPYGRSTLDEGSSEKADSPVEIAEFTSLPLGSSLKRASIDGGKVVIEISIPMWEGYL